MAAVFNLDIIFGSTVMTLCKKNNILHCSKMTCIFFFLRNLYFFIVQPMVGWVLCISLN